MPLTAADIEIPATDLDALELLAHHLELAQTGRLEELFECMQRSRMPYDPLDAARECALSLALWSLRSDDIERVASNTLSLFGLQGRARYVDESWIEPVFKREFPKALSAGLSMFHRNVQEALWVPDGLLDLGRLLLMSVPGFALRSLDALQAPDGLSLSEHLVGEQGYGELREKFSSGWGMLPRPDELALQVCKLTLCEAQQKHGYATLPDRIDGEPLANSVRAELETELAHREAEDRDIPF